MRELDEREKELLRKLREAGKPQNHFTLSLKINDIIIEERVFPADKYSLETLTETRTHFLMNDLIRLILKEFSEVETKNQEQIKKEQMERMWKDNEQPKK